MPYIIPVLRIFLFTFIAVHTLAATPFCAVVHKERPVEQGIADTVVQVVMQSALVPPSAFDVYIDTQDLKPDWQHENPNTFPTTTQLDSLALSTKDVTGKPIYASEIQKYISGFDKWGTFSSAADIKENLPVPNAGSVGMALVENRQKEVVCIPYPHGPAAKAGIQEGDILMGVHSIASARKVFKGNIGSTLTIVVERNGDVHSFTLKREKFTPPHVDLIQHEDFARIRIWYFDKNTSKLFAEKVQQAGNQALVIDIRANSGGNILSARNCAAEFLPKGVLLGISQIRENKADSLPQKKYIRTSKDGKFLHVQPLILWQDNLTASAAEAFIVALLDNERALSIGSTTFGKAHAQSSFNVRGNVLTLSTEALLRLDNNSWDQRGVDASIYKIPTYANLFEATLRQIF